jgi:hypothetical protein
MGGTMMTAMTMTAAGQGAIAMMTMIRQLYTLLSRKLPLLGFRKERSHDYRHYKPHLSRRSQGSSPSGDFTLER